MQGFLSDMPEFSDNNQYSSKRTLKDRKFQVHIDRSRDDNLSAFGKTVLQDRYLVENEGFQDLFARVAGYYADSPEHAQRLYDAMSKLWFMPATPILSNGGTRRGLPISCFLNESGDSIHEIVDTWNENVWLAAKGGGIGTYWGNVRSIGERVSGGTKTSGVIPFICVQDSLVLAISQGNLRRGSAAVYLPVWHPEIEEFIEMRRTTGGDHNRKALNLHHGVVIPDSFMHAVESDGPWNLKSPATNQILRTIKARDLWIRILLARIETGEPYIVYIDAVENNRPEVYKRNNLHVKTSNLCSEITLTTGKDYDNMRRTAVCCLSSLNLEHYDEWKDDKDFIPDVMRFLDNVLEDFISAPLPFATSGKSDPFEDAKYSASRERSVGLGVMGFHSLMQSKMISLASDEAQALNEEIFSMIQTQADQASYLLALEKGPCPDAARVGLMERFSNKTAIAPTASISIIAGGSSPGIEPYPANAYMHKSLSGSQSVKNKNLAALLAKKEMDNEEVWLSIMTHEGSVQHLDFLSDHEKEVFKTAFEIDQMILIHLAAARQKYISQAQSLNVFLSSSVSKKYLNELHKRAWILGLKSLYYSRSKSVLRTQSSLSVSPTQEGAALPASNSNIAACKLVEVNTDNSTDDSECIVCQ